MVDKTDKTKAPEATNKTPLAEGIAVIRSEAKTMPNRPGVYRMLDENGRVLYIGKAKNLKNRVTSYTRINGLSIRIARMVARTRSMMIITTHTEAEALLLEATLIKKLKPQYNVFLRDDKSFPYIHLRTNHEWAQTTKHRGRRKSGGSYYGPFASAGAVNQTLNTLQRVFLLRSCSDTTLTTRTRPCLLYQIKRCSAPCVGAIPAAEYAALVADAKAFLEGRETGIQKRLARDMQQASNNQEYEKAAAIRDRLKALTQVQAHQTINLRGLGNADVMALYRDGNLSSVQVFFIRAGQNWGNRSYFPRHSPEDSDAQILGAFIAQFYDSTPPPGLVLVSHTPEAKELLQTALTERAEQKVQIVKPARGARRAIVESGIKNAEGALARKMAESASQAKLLSSIATAFDLDNPPERIEVYDNSHISGSHPVGAMIVAGPEGFRKNAYRKFNIKNKDITGGDDFAMMREVMTRRFSRLQREDPERASDAWPDLVLIDGGRGQLNAVIETLEDLGVDGIPLVAISKGKDRNAGREQFHMQGREAFIMKDGDPTLYFLQRLRDEAHRFAIGSHRTRRSGAISGSPLDDVPGIGAKRKKALLHHFGSAKAVAGAGIKDLMAVEGISQMIAQTIYDHFHDNG